MGEHALVVLIAGLAYAVVLALGFASLEAANQPIGHSYFILLEALILVLAPVMVALMKVVQADRRGVERYDPSEYRDRWLPRRLSDSRPLASSALPAFLLRDRTCIVKATIVLQTPIRGQSLVQWATALTTCLGLIGLGGRLIFAMMPALCGRLSDTAE